MRLWSSKLGDFYPPLVAFCLETKRYLIVLFCLILVWFNVAIGLPCLIVSCAYLLLRSHHNRCCNCSFDGIKNSIRYIGNHFEQPKWYFYFSVNFSKQTAKVECLFYDRFKWEQRDWDEGCAFYLTINPNDFDKNILVELEEYLNKIGVGVERTVNDELKFGRRHDGNVILDIERLIYCLDRIFGEVSSSHFFVKFQQPILNQDKFAEFISILRKGKALPEMDKIGRPLDGMKMLELSGLGKL